MKNLLIKSAIISGVALSLATATRPAMASSFAITVEDPGVQNANLSNLVNAHVQTFDGLKQGFSEAGFQWNEGTTKIGTYTNTLIENADQYGGAGGKGQYFDVDTSRSGKGQTYSTLKLDTPQSYLGLWWSAGDINNKLEFISKGQVVESLTTQDVVSYLSKIPNAKSYMGNPTQKFNGQDNWEPFAFLNFYDVGGTFDEVKFSNVGGTGFESDNHTIATSYKKITGNVVKSVPESSSVVGVLAVAFVGASSVLKRRVLNKSISS